MLRCLVPSQTPCFQKDTLLSERDLAFQEGPCFPRAFHAFWQRQQGVFLVVLLTNYTKESTLYLRLSSVAFLILVLAVCVASQAEAQSNLQRFDNCRFVEADWADGDSFLVKNALGEQFTLRLYGVDCLESQVNDDSDARRLRGQRRYFGISGYGGNSLASIGAAKRMGEEAKEFVVAELKQPFTVFTAFADARGDGRYKRYYGFITTSNGKDLAEQLVRLGHARAFGVNRSTPDGKTRDEHRELLKDLEFQAAIRGVGVWKITDWESLPEQRRAEREEVAELNLAKGIPQPLDLDAKIKLNSAPRDVIMRLPGVGEAIANRIIEGRPYKSIESVIEVDGIGSKKLEQIRPFLILDNSWVDLPAR